MSKMIKTQKENQKFTKIQSIEKLELLDNIGKLLAESNPKAENGDQKINSRAKLYSDQNLQKLAIYGEMDISKLAISKIDQIIIHHKIYLSGPHLAELQAQGLKEVKGIASSCLVLKPNGKPIEVNMAEVHLNGIDTLIVGENVTLRVTNDQVMGLKNIIGAGAIENVFKGQKLSLSHLDRFEACLKVSQKDAARCNEFQALMQSMNNDMPKRKAPLKKKLYAKTSQTLLKLLKFLFLALFYVSMTSLALFTGFVILPFYLAGQLIEMARQWFHLDQTEMHQSSS